MRDQRRLGPNLVDRIDHTVAGRQQFGRILDGNELLDRRHVATWIDAGNPLPHRLHLGLAEGRLDRMDLPVEVGFGNVVEIDQRQSADTAARQRLDRP